MLPPPDPHTLIPPPRCAFQRPSWTEQRQLLRPQERYFISFSCREESDNTVEHSASAKRDSGMPVRRWTLSHIGVTAVIDVACKSEGKSKGVHLCQSPNRPSRAGRFWRHRGSAADCGCPRDQDGE